MHLSSQGVSPHDKASAIRRAEEIIETIRACSYSCDAEMRRLPLKLVPELRGLLDWHRLTTKQIGSSDVEVADILQGVPGRSKPVEAFGFGSPAEFDFAEVMGDSVPAEPETQAVEESVVRRMPIRTTVGANVRKDSQARRFVADLFRDTGDKQDEDLFARLGVADG